MENTRDMTKGSPARLLFFFAIPLMLGNLFQQLYTMVDTIIVGQGVGVQALASLGAADWLNWLFQGIATGLTQGFSILFAQFYGARNEEALKKSIGNSIVLTLAAAVLLTAAGEILLTGILNLLKTPQDIYGGASIYLRIMFGGIPVVLFYNLEAALLRALGDSKSPLIAMVVAACTNIALDLLFVMVFHWGIPGAAAATIIAQCVSLLYCLAVIRKISIVRPGREDFRLGRSLCRQLLGLGIPVMFQNTVISVGGMVVQSVINGFGFLFVAGFTATNKLYGLLETAAISFGFSITTFVAQNMGAGNYGRIRKGMRSGAAMALLTSVVVSAIMLLFGRQILSLFISADAGQADEVLYIAFHYLTIMSIFLAVLYALHAYRCALQGLGDTVTPMVSGIAEFVMRVLAALLLPRVMGQEGIYYAEILAWIGAAAILVTAYYRRMGREKGRV
ncbi:MATE family efflux transporter [Murimonas intestini]|uniref:Probable multidrug resistance protein NorM n=1 Tax=Murimonas intestini TaxID=1337051 RepID=A0AB73T2P7_9FIRM|nr:MATE family efflux transporter [Murimonas intestini]MCR1841752.1 MATE family efflux transporter [Murimonas intestini]MCR1865569.1 MATE family efflux transporter [Murimonas intestini]MCR1883850.1 MATE family efflux transporter [Murimonas intestini]